MNEAQFVSTILENPINATILERLSELQRHAPQVHLTSSALFGTVWNVQSGQASTQNIPDYDLFYWHPDTSYEAEDEVIAFAEQFFQDVEATIELRNQARVHLWFNQKYGLRRPPIISAQQGIEQFLVCCTCVGIDAAGQVYAPYGLDELEKGILRLNPLNHSPNLYAAKVHSYRQRWKWLCDLEEQETTKT